MKPWQILHESWLPWWRRSWVVTVPGSGLRTKRAWTLEGADKKGARMHETYLASQGHRR